MTVRELRWADFQGWVDLYFDRYEEVRTNPELGVFLHPTRPTLGEEAAVFGGVHRKVLEGTAIALVAEEDRRVVGVCTVYGHGGHVEDRHVGSLGIAVHREWRRRGLGSALVGAAVEASRGRFELLQLSVIDANESAQRLYTRHGFEACGRFPRAFKRGERYFDEILMWRSVESTAP
jgi:ribosomal protein S18 acetylase RimI-like enzyme